MSCNKNMDMLQTDLCQKLTKLLEIQNQISTISMQIPRLVKIHWHLLKLFSRNKNTDRPEVPQMDGRTSNVIP